MGFVGGGGNIVISTALPPSFCVLYCKHRIVYGIHYLTFFYACQRRLFPDVETYPGMWLPVPTVCRLLCNNVRGLAGNLGDPTVASSQYDMLFCSETLVSDMHHVVELLVPGFGRPALLCRGRMLRAEGWWHTYEMDMVHFANPSLSVVVAKCWFLGFVV